MASHTVTASAAARHIKHDVFINFRGTDTRNNFISHLRAALERNGIDAFMDKGLKGGEEILTMLSNKISESQVSVVIFSPDYASSRWCLDELVRIMQCKEVNGQTVLPVFLQGVEPTHVRKQTGAFGNAFGRLLQDDRFADKVESWRCALKQAAHLTGWVSNEISESEIVEKILNHIQSVLGQMSSHDSFSHFVEIALVEEVDSIIFSPKIRCLGIWGMGGSGKTTLAKKIYSRVYKNFDASCFIGNVREFAEKHKLNLLRGYMLSKLLGKHDPIEDYPIIFHGEIQRKLGRKRVLVILDDISDVSQLLELTSDFNFSDSQSKIIATSRDKQVLQNVCDKVYEVHTLNDHESFQLLKFHILKQQQPTPDQMKLLKQVIKYAQGLPLALVVLGRNLYGKDITIWKNELAKLSNIPNLEIMKILRISFDGLEEIEKSIFLDIACLSQVWKKDRIESILDTCGFYAVRGIARLVDKALITISNGTIKMHDLIRQMGQHIAFHEGIEATGKPSRLWRNKDIIDFLTKKQETERMRKIEIISMDLLKATSIKLNYRVFKQMICLRILRFHINPTENIIISLPNGLKYLPDRLQYLEWDKYPIPCLPPQFNPENLVELNMVDSRLKHLWSGEVEPSLPNLKRVNLSGSKSLTKLPKFRNALKLESLLARGCKVLKDVPSSMQHLVELKCFDLSDNTRLARIPELSQLTKLETLSLKGCFQIKHLPQLPRNLIWLDLSYTKVKELPSTVQGMCQLKYLGWMALPFGINELKDVIKLDLGRRVKSDIGDLKSIARVIITRSPLNSLLEPINRIRSLMKLSCSGCNDDTLPSLKGLASLSPLYLGTGDLKGLLEDIKHPITLEIFPTESRKFQFNTTASTKLALLRCI